MSTGDGRRTPYVKSFSKIHVIRYNYYLQNTFILLSLQHKPLSSLSSHLIRHLFGGNEFLVEQKTNSNGSSVALTYKYRNFNV